MTSKNGIIEELQCDIDWNKKYGPDPAVEILEKYLRLIRQLDDRSQEMIEWIADSKRHADEERRYIRELAPYMYSMGESWMCEKFLRTFHLDQLWIKGWDYDVG